MVIPFKTNLQAERYRFNEGFSDGGAGFALRRQEPSSTGLRLDLAANAWEGRFLGRGWNREFLLRSVAAGVMDDACSWREEWRAVRVGMASVC